MKNRWEKKKTTTVEINNTKMYISYISTLQYITKSRVRFYVLHHESAHTQNAVRPAIPLALSKLTISVFYKALSNSVITLRLHFIKMKDI